MNKATRTWTSAAASVALLIGMAFVTTAEAVPCKSSHLAGVGSDGSCQSSVTRNQNSINLFGIKTWDLSGNGKVKGNRQGLMELVNTLWGPLVDLKGGYDGPGKKLGHYMKGWKKADFKWDRKYSKKWRHKRHIDHPGGGSDIPAGGGTITSVSEPAALAMLVGGLGLGAVVLRRRLLR